MTASDPVITPTSLGRDLRRPLADDERRCVEQQLATTGYVLFRGFPVDDVADFAAVVEALGGERLGYAERSSPRTQLRAGIYTSTEYAPEEEIFFHNENSYQSSWPARLFFHCEQPASSGGATPLADTRTVTRLIDPSVVREFRERGWRHVRNYHPHFGLSWAEVFGTTDRTAVDRYCRANAIRTEWREDGTLRTEADRAALHRHPVGREELWFNHVAFFHWSTLPAPVAEVMTELFGRDGLPNDTVFGDGAPIPEDTCAHLREQYRAAATRFAYRRGDVLMIDNMYVAHGREPFRGPRRVAVAMTGAPRSARAVGKEALDR